MKQFILTAQRYGGEKIEPENNHKTSKIINLLAANSTYRSIDNNLSDKLRNCKNIINTPIVTRYFIKAHTLTALIYLLLLSYFQYDFFFKFIPVILLLQFVSFF